jgi:hypothetical protein
MQRRQKTNEIAKRAGKKDANPGTNGFGEALSGQFH